MTINPTTPTQTSAAQDQWWEWIWPSLATAASARYAVKQGLWAAIISAVGVVVVVASNTLSGQLDPHMPFGIGALIDAAAFTTIAVGLWRESRFAAVCGLTLYVIEQLYAWSQSRSFSPLAVIFAIAFANAVRGTFMLRRIAAGRETDHAS
jgi:hypothetical protein